MFFKYNLLDIIYFNKRLIKEKIVIVSRIDRMMIIFLKLFFDCVLVEYFVCFVVLFYLIVFLLMSLEKKIKEFFFYIFRCIKYYIRNK